MKKAACGFLILIFTLFAGLAWAGQQEDLESLGGLLYKDKNLSLNKNQSCQTCHHPSAGFEDPVNADDPISFPVSAGSDPTLYGGRNAPTSAYAGFSPVFSWDKSIGDAGGYVGGMFWDGRATGETLGDPLAEQALGPFTNSVEMAMEDHKAVVDAVSVSSYSDLFLKVFPETDFSDIERTYNNIGRAIAAFERSDSVTRFTSKFDQFWKACQKAGVEVSEINASTDLSKLPKGILTITQLQGLALFNEKAGCAACHSTTNHIDQAGNIYPPLFTNYTYDNIGLPVNDRLYVLAGGAAPDLGLGGRDDVLDTEQYGKFKVPTLRNVNKSAPYGHNGYFPTLKDMVNFLNTRDIAEWDDPDVSETVNTTDLGNLNLSRDEEWQIVVFLNSLTDQN